MMGQENSSAAALEVTIDILREAGGFVSAWVYSPAGELIVRSPPCDSQAGAVDMAQAMWSRRELVLSPDLAMYGLA